MSFAPNYKAMSLRNQSNKLLKTTQRELDRAQSILRDEEIRRSNQRGIENSYMRQAAASINNKLQDFSSMNLRVSGNPVKIVVNQSSNLPELRSSRYTAADDNSIIAQSSFDPQFQTKFVPQLELTRDLIVTKLIANGSQFQPQFEQKYSNEDVIAVLRRSREITKQKEQLSQMQEAALSRVIVDRFGQELQQSQVAPSYEVYGQSKDASCQADQYVSGKIRVPGQDSQGRTDGQISPAGEHYYQGEGLLSPEVRRIIRSRPDEIEKQQPKVQHSVLGKQFCERCANALARGGFGCDVEIKQNEATHGSQLNGQEGDQLELKSGELNLGFGAQSESKTAQNQQVQRLKERECCGQRDAADVVGELTSLQQQFDLKAQQQDQPLVELEEAEGQDQGNQDSQNQEGSGKAGQDLGKISNKKQPMEQEQSASQSVGRKVSKYEHKAAATTSAFGFEVFIHPQELQLLQQLFEEKLRSHDVAPLNKNDLDSLQFGQQENNHKQLSESEGLVVTGQNNYQTIYNSLPLLQEPVISASVEESRVPRDYEKPWLSTRGTHDVLPSQQPVFNPAVYLQQNRQKVAEMSQKSHLAKQQTEKLALEKAKPLNQADRPPMAPRQLSQAEADAIIRRNAEQQKLRKRFDVKQKQQDYFSSQSDNNYYIQRNIEATKVLSQNAGFENLNNFQSQNTVEDLGYLGEPFTDLQMSGDFSGLDVAQARTYYSQFQNNQDQLNFEQYLNFEQDKVIQFDFQGNRAQSQAVDDILLKTQQLQDEFEGKFERPQVQEAFHDPLQIQYQRPASQPLVEVKAPSRDFKTDYLSFSQLTTKVQIDESLQQQMNKNIEVNNRKKQKPSFPASPSHLLNLAMYKKQTPINVEQNIVQGKVSAFQQQMSPVAIHQSAVYCPKTPEHYRIRRIDPEQKFSRESINRNLNFVKNVQRNIPVTPNQNVVLLMAGDPKMTLGDQAAVQQFAKEVVSSGCY